jgi:hypothetical protein
MGLPAIAGTVLLLDRHCVGADSWLDLYGKLRLRDLRAVRRLALYVHPGCGVLHQNMLDV